MIKRALESTLISTLKRPKSILLLGPRQTGKTTLLRTLDSDLSLNLALPSDRRRFESRPELIISEVQTLKGKCPVLIVDEIQKVPSLMDPIQTLIDDRKAIFILTGSSARKLRRQSTTNLLPGRVISLRLDPLTQAEFVQPLEDQLIYGSLPGIVSLNVPKLKNQELRSYVDAYLEEEIRAEALVRRLAPFYRFMELCALESGRIVSFNSIGQQIGVAHTTVSSYYEVLVDCLILERVDPITESSTRKRLMKSSRFLFFDMGVRRLAANEGSKLGLHRLGELFEQYVGLELIRLLRQSTISKLYFWRDAEGPEVDWVIKSHRKYLPIEVKYSEAPQQKDARHLMTFMKEYPCPYGGYIVCQTPRRFKIQDNIWAVSWTQLKEIVDQVE